MSDPWKDVRGMLDKAAVQVEPTAFALDGRALRDLLDDADALLAVVRTLPPMIEHEKTLYERVLAGDDVFSDEELDTVSEWTEARDKALAALPEHLKG